MASVIEFHVSTCLYFNSFYSFLISRCIEIRELAQEVSREFDTKERYLCERLEVEPCEYLERKRKYPRVAQISLSKLKTMLDLLLSAGFEPKDIFKHAEVLTFSPETIEVRSKWKHLIIFRTQGGRDINFTIKPMG